jgi:uncharacterized protein YciI
MRSGIFAIVTPMMGFVFRLVPPRPSFVIDMTPAERATMMEHVAYWSDLSAQGKVLAFGPVADAATPYGIGIFVAESRSEAEAIRDGDPAVRSTHGFSGELAPMLRLVTPTAVYDATPA